MFYQPWIGAEYVTTRRYYHALCRDMETGDLPLGTGYRIHVMGESHYGDPHEHTSDNTIRIVRECAFAPDHAKNSQFFTRVAGVIADVFDVPRTGDYRRAIWERLAFSNFVQQLLSINRRAPDAQQWREGQASFVEQLRLTTPSLLFVLGWRRWQHLPDDDCIELGTIDAFGADTAPIPGARAYVYLSDGCAYSTLVVPVPHPSSGGHFSASEAAARLRTGWLAQGGIAGSDRVQERMTELLAGAARP